MLVLAVIFMLFRIADYADYWETKARIQSGYGTWLDYQTIAKSQLKNKENLLLDILITDQWNTLPATNNEAEQEKN